MVLINLIVQLPEQNKDETQSQREKKKSVKTYFEDPLTSNQRITTLNLKFLGFWLRHVGVGSAAPQLPIVKFENSPKNSNLNLIIQNCWNEWEEEVKESGKTESTRRKITENSEMEDMLAACKTDQDGRKTDEDGRKTDQDGRHENSGESGNEAETLPGLQIISKEIRGLKSEMKEHFNSFGETLRRDMKSDIVNFYSTLHHRGVNVTV